MNDTLFDDLFIPDHAATVARGLECLRDAVPNALEVLARLEWWQPNDSHSPGACGDWAYLVCRAGLHFGARSGDAGEWAGWDSKPRHLIPWTELQEILGDDPRRGEIIAWADGLPQPNWKDLYRPYELWPHPETWHPSHIASDHARSGWEGRKHAWELVQATLTDTVCQITRKD